MQRCMLPAWLVLLLVTWSAAAAAVPLPVRQDLFVNGAKYSIIYPCYRQPALLRSGRVLLAFAEGRNITSCAPPISMQPAGPPPASNEIGGLVLRRSLDEGASWSEPRTLVSGDIDFYTMVYDSITHTVHLMLQDAGVAYFTSSDYGLTWSSPVQLKVSANSFDFVSSLQTPGLNPADLALSIFLKHGLYHWVCSLPFLSLFSFSFLLSSPLFYFRLSYFLNHP